jgi:hypothetical protein
MNPLQILRIFDYQQSNAEQTAAHWVRNASSSKDAQSKLNKAASAILVERRKTPDRRASDRREKQHATFLNTRKNQGRRAMPGRRASDMQVKMDYRSISFKG